MVTSPSTSGRSALDPAIASRLKRDPQGLVAAVVQQHDTGEVLMLAWMDDEALHRTLTTGRCTYWSRSRQEYWVKGETSGHTQQVHEIRLDCDGDTLLFSVEQEGGACHTGDRTCFDADLVLAGGTKPSAVIVSVGVPLVSSVAPWNRIRCRSWFTTTAALSSSRYSRPLMARNEVTTSVELTR